MAVHKLSTGINHTSGVPVPADSPDSKYCTSAKSISHFVDKFSPAPKFSMGAQMTDLALQVS